MHKNLKIGFIGQGWIGKNYADDFEKRGYNVVRYSLEENFKQNKSIISSCEITFIAVPTPTTPKGFDDSYLNDALTNIGKNKIAVIKSTTTPGLVNSLQVKFPDIVILHNPEFLVEKSAAFDAANPNRNIIGIPNDTNEYREAANKVLDTLPKAPYSAIMLSIESELVKYAGNGFLYTKVLFMNILHDVVVKSGGDWEVVREAMINDPRIGVSHTQPIHDNGRGAGGHCFIKDFEAFRRYYLEIIGDNNASTLLNAQINYNNELLKQSNKDVDLLENIYGT